jgi:hypothetical protein
MSILDDAIREHLELKRAHGADDSELKKLEDEAFGPPQRPDQADPFAEAPTEFLAAPGEVPAAIPEIGDEAARGGRRPDIADLQEALPAPSEEPPASESGAPSTGSAPDAEAAPPEAGSAADEAAPPAAGSVPSEELAPAPDAPPPAPSDAADAPPPPPADEAPAAVEAPAAEEPVTGEAIAEGGPNTEERHAIADQPTQMFDVQAHVDAEAPAAEENVPEPPSAEAPAPAQEPLDTRGPDAEVAGHPPAEAAPSEEESAEYDFFNEQRLSDELDQALEAPLPPTDEHIAMPQYGDAPPPAQTGIFDFESESRYEEDPSEEVLRRHDAEPPSDEYEAPSEEYEQPSEETPHAGAGSADEGSPDYDPATGHEDVLEDTPTFLENAPEDDDLWFEQKPPKDFDL